jgi:hypothetical protein
VTWHVSLFLRQGRDRSQRRYPALLCSLYPAACLPAQPLPQALSAAQSSASESATHASTSAGRIEELTSLVEARTREAEAAAARATAAERALEAANMERDALEKKVARLERAKEDTAKGEGGRC